MVRISSLIFLKIIKNYVADPQMNITLFPEPDLKKWVK
jgi:hypothetical protein